MRQHPVNKANRKALQDFVSAMRKLKPQKRNYPRGGYGQAVKNWQKAYSVGSKWHNKINDLNNILYRT